jgi:hypothetical protein
VEGLAVVPGQLAGSSLTGQFRQGVFDDHVDVFPAIP